MSKALLLAPMCSVHERFNEGCIGALKDLGYEVSIVANFSGDTEETINHNKAYREKLEDRNIKTFHIDFRRASLRKNLKKIKEIKALIKQENFDIVHCHTETGGILTAIASKKFKNTKFYFTPHGMSFYKGGSKLKNLIYGTIEKWICKKMDQNIAMNQEEFENLIKWNKLSANYIHGTGFDVKKYNLVKVDPSSKKKELEIESFDKVILSVGELNDNKNHLSVIKALKDIKDVNFVYLICGVGELKDKILATAKEFGLEDRVKLLGYRRDINEILKVADAFIFPSFHEGLPVSVMEAMASGVPMAISKIRGNVDLVSDNVNGYLFEPTDIEKIKESIYSLLTDLETSKKFSKKSLDVIKDFDKSVVEKEMKEIYLK